MELIHLDRVLAVVYEVARLLNALTAKGEQLAGIVEGNLFLPLKAADAIS